ncbi:hypothetical protein [Pseudomonas sp. SDO52101_S400]
MIAQILAADTVATATTGFGLTEKTLIRVIDRVAATASCFCIAHPAQSRIVDAVATAATGFGLAVTALIPVIDRVATTTAFFRIAHPAQVRIVDVVTAATAGLGLAISALIRIVDIHAASKGMAGEGKHQQHRQYFLHHTLPWYSSQQTGTV